MALIGNKQIIAWLEMNGNAHWVLKHNKADNGSPIAKTPDEHNYSMGDSVKRLSDCFGMLANKGTYYIITRPTHDSKGTAGIFNDYIELGVEGQAAGVAGFNHPAMSGQYVPVDDVDRKIANAITKALDDKRKDDKIEKLQEQLAEQTKAVKELSKNTMDERFARIMGVLEPYLPSMLGLAKPAAVMGVGTVGFKEKAEVTEAEVDKESERFRTACEGLEEIFSKHDMSLIDIMEKLHHKALENEDSFITMVKMIG